MQNSRRIPCPLFSIFCGLWAAITLLAAAGVYKLVPNSFLDEAAILALAAIGYCVLAVAVRKRKLWAGKFGLIICLVGFIMAFYIPIPVLRATPLVLSAGPLAIAAILICRWNDFTAAPPARFRLHPAIACAFLIVILAAIWFSQVRSPRLEAGRFERLPNGVVLDHQTRLEWYVGPEKLEWIKAKDWVEKLNIDGKAFRLPTRNELAALYVKRPDGNNIDPAFGVKKEHWVWASEQRRPSLLATVLGLEQLKMAGNFMFPFGTKAWHIIGTGDYGNALAVRETPAS